LLPIPAVRCDQFNPRTASRFSQSESAVVTTIGDQAQRFLPRPPGMGFGGPTQIVASVVPRAAFRAGCRTKVLFPKEDPGRRPPPSTSCPCPAWFFPTPAPPFWREQNSRPRKDSLHCSCFRSLSSARNARQILSQTPCSSQSRSLRQHVAGEGNSSGKSCQRAPLRRIHKCLRAPCGRRRVAVRRVAAKRGRGSKGRIFSHWRRSADDRIAPSALQRRS